MKNRQTTIEGNAPLIRPEIREVESYEPEQIEAFLNWFSFRSDSTTNQQKDK